MDIVSKTDDGANDPVPEEDQPMNEEDSNDEREYQPPPLFLDTFSSYASSSSSVYIAPNPSISIVHPLRQEAAAAAAQKIAAAATVPLVSASGPAPPPRKAPPAARLRSPKPVSPEAPSSVPSVSTANESLPVIENPIGTPVAQLVESAIPESRTQTPSDNRPVVVTPDPEEFVRAFAEVDAKEAELTKVRHELVQQLKALGGVVPGAPRKSQATGNEALTKTVDGAGAHWDYLLKEMAWMSNDFRVERKWKSQSAKKLVKETERVILRKEAEKKQESSRRVASLRRQATKVAREVKKNFWEKIDRIVLFKNNADYVAEQQQIMDRNLDRLLVQTERYTESLIATATTMARKRRRAERENQEARRKKDAEAEQEAIANLMVKYTDQSNKEVSRKRLKQSPAVEETNGTDTKGTGTATYPITSDAEARPRETLENEDLSDASWQDSGEEESEDISEGETGNPEDDGTGDKLVADLDLPLEELLRREYGISINEARSSTPDEEASGLREKRHEKKDRTRMASGQASTNGVSVIEEKSHLAELASADAGVGDEDESWSDSGADEPEEEIDVEDEINPEDDGNTAALEADLDMPIEELLTKVYGISKDQLAEGEQATGPEGDATGSKRNRKKKAGEVQPGATQGMIELASGTQLNTAGEEGVNGNGTDDESWQAEASSAMDVDDDIEAEDEHNADDDGNAKGLEDDMNIPIEELLARRYGISGDSHPSDQPMSTSDSNLKVLLEDAFEDDNGDDGSFSPSDEDGSDNEDTLIEAEATIKDDCTVDQLKAEAEMPLEELLNREYHGLVLGNAAEEAKMDLNREMVKSDDNASSVSGERRRKKKSRAAIDLDEEAGLVKEAEEEPAEVDVPLPFLLSKDRPLRAYQREGLNWLVSLHDRQLNGILADEMGLGKTAQTIALLAHLAGSSNIWGPHLIVVPTSVILNWDLEFKTWCPGLKVMTYFGSTAERAAKRTGWTKPNAFHVCVTSYQLAVQDASVFRRKKWYYIICDEAHALKNSKSQRWQTLLSFQAKRRLLITGTPLQNSLMELWSLMHFLMPEVFRSQHEFKHWFSNPLQAIVEEGDKRNASAVKRLHAVMRPFILRRLKRDVAKQLPSKYEHIVRLPLARRQRFLYEDFISHSSTQAALRSGGYVEKMSILMKLRMVCNHPDLFEPRLVTSAFCVDELVVEFPRCILDIWRSPLSDLPLETLLSDREFSSNLIDQDRGILPPTFRLRTKLGMSRAVELQPDPLQMLSVCQAQARSESVPRQWRLENDLSTELCAAVPVEIKATLSLLYGERAAALMNEKNATSQLLISNNARRLEQSRPVLGYELIEACASLLLQSSFKTVPASLYLYDNSIERRLEKLAPVLQRFVFVTPVAQGTVRLPFNRNERTCAAQKELLDRSVALNPEVSGGEALLHPIAIRQRVSFPDKFLVQYDCGKLQTLAVMLQRLKRDGHRVLIFTQMSRMLDILERFLNLHSHTYFRLDGATKVEDRQSMMDRFNRDPRIFCFILSTRSGGLGINLTGADTVIFYDSDWNPSMDAQAQDRAHRIGQTKDVHIYRLVSEQTIEENILTKSNQKRHLNKLSVEEGNFSSLLMPQANNQMAAAYEDIVGNEDLLAQVEDESDRLAAKRAMQEEQEIREEEQGFRDEAATPALAQPKKVDHPDEEEEEQGEHPDDQDKMEDQQGNVLMTKAQFQELESKLKPVDQYGIDFRTHYFILYDPLKEARRKKELEKAQMIEVQTKDWELETLERNKRLAEQEAEEDLVADKSSRLLEAEAEAAYRAAQRCFNLERKLRKMTGRAWKLTYEKGHGERKPFYLNEDTKETTWERPRILDAEEERRVARAKGWAALPVSALTRIAWFLSPSARAQHFHLVCTRWWRAVEGNALFCVWVEPTDRVGAPGSSSGEFLTVGSVVEARHQGLEVWYAATVVDSLADGCLSVLFTDGEVEKNMRRELVRKDRGARTTLMRHSKGGPLFETLNLTLASDFACGAPIPDPPRYINLTDALSAQGRQGAVIVLRAGKHNLLSDGSDGNNCCSPGVRLVGEAFWAREKNAFEIATARVLPDDEQSRKSKRGGGGNAAGRSLSADVVGSVDVLDSSRASVIVGSTTISGGSIAGIVFQSRVTVKASSLSPEVRFVECTFTRGVEMVSGRAVFLGCFFMGNGDGPGLLVKGNTCESIVLDRCRIANNRAGIEFGTTFTKFSAVSISGCEFKANRQGAVIGPVAPTPRATVIPVPASVTQALTVPEASSTVAVAGVEHSSDLTSRADSAAPSVPADADPTVSPSGASGVPSSSTPPPAGVPSPQPGPMPQPEPTAFQVWRQKNAASLTTSKFIRPKFTPLQVMNQFRPVALLQPKRSVTPSSSVPSTVAGDAGTTASSKKRSSPSPPAGPSSSSLAASEAAQTASQPTSKKVRRQGPAVNGNGKKKVSGQSTNQAKPSEMVTSAGGPSSSTAPGHDAEEMR